MVLGQAAENRKFETPEIPGGAEKNSQRKGQIIPGS